MLAGFFLSIWDKFELFMWTQYRLSICIGKILFVYVKSTINIYCPDFSPVKYSANWTYHKSWQYSSKLPIIAKSNMSSTVESSFVNKKETYMNFSLILSMNFVCISHANQRNLSRASANPTCKIDGETRNNDKLQIVDSINNRVIKCVGENFRDKR